jgi:predicted nucleic acid-binding protein
MSFMTAFDTNILIYACDKADPVKQDRAIRLIENATHQLSVWDALLLGA